MAEDLEGRTLLSVGLDPTWGFGGSAQLNQTTNTATNSFFQSLDSIALQNGQVVEVGTLFTDPVGGGTETETMFAARLNASGFLDASFGTGGMTMIPVSSGGVNFDVRATDIKVDPSGNIDVLGTATPHTGGGSSQFLVAQLNSNGSLNSGFGQSGPGFQLISFGAGTNASAVRLAIGTLNKVVAVGSVDTATTGTVFGVTRLNTNGSLDTTFNTVGTTTVAFNTAVGVAASANNDTPSDVVVQPDGKVVVVGQADLPTSTLTPQPSDIVVARLTPVGTIDNNFNGSGIVAINYQLGGTNSEDNAAAVALSGTQIVIAGTSTKANPPISGTNPLNQNINQLNVTRLNTNGSFDTTFNGSGKFMLTLSQSGTVFNSSASAVVVSASGALLVGGNAHEQNNSNSGFFGGGGGPSGGLLLSLTPTGALDTSFGTNGAAIIPESVSSPMLMQNDGKVVFVSGNDVDRTTAPAPAVTTTTIITTGTGKKAKASGVTITFNTGINPSLASNVKVYLVRPSNKKTAIKLKKKNGIVYDPTKQTLTFNFASKMAVGKGFLVVITPGGIVGADGQVLSNLNISIPPATT